VALSRFTTVLSRRSISSARRSVTATGSSGEFLARSRREPMLTGGAKMGRCAFGAVIVGLILTTTGVAWALSEADTGNLWAQAPSNQKIQVANILSRELGGDPWKYVQCLDAIFGDAANAKLTIRDAAEQCKARQ